MAWHYGKFAWFEHVSNDTAKARQFYESLFGWKVKAFSPGGYEVIHNGADFIGGVVSAENGEPNHWRSWLSVPDVDAKWQEALSSGAQPVMPPRDYPGIGRGATLLDPSGARVSIWKGAQGDRPDTEKVASGDWDWNELATHEPGIALAFYTSMFGYTREDWNMGAQGSYHILKDAQGLARAGVMKLSHTEARPAWVPYVKVEDTDAIASRVGPLGGSLCVQPMDVESVGRIAMLVDPTGAPLGFITPAVVP